MNPIHIGIGIAILGVLMLCGWLVATRRVTVSAQPQEPDTVDELLAPSYEQKVRDRIAPIFKDRMDKEHAAKVTEAMYAAYKGVKIDVNP